MDVSEVVVDVIVLVIDVVCALELDVVVNIDTVEVVVIIVVVEVIWEVALDVTVVDVDV